MLRANPASMMYLGIRGTVVALDRRTGAELWRTPLKGCDFVNVALDGDSLFATARGEIYCLDPITGRIQWANPLKGLGWGLITIAGTDIAPMAQQRAREQQRANGAAAASA
jgi:outer membrane protein assembly factor BamB